MASERRDDERAVTETLSLRSSQTSSIVLRLGCLTPMLNLIESHGVVYSFSANVSRLLS